MGLLAFSDRIRASVPPAGGRSAMVRLVRATYDLHPELVEPDYGRALTHLAGELRQRTLVVIVTRVADDAAADSLARYARGLLPRHLPLIILLRDPELESMALVRPGDQEADLFARAAAAELLGWHDRLVLRLRRQGAHVLDVEPKQLTADLVSRYLEIKVMHLL